MNKRGLYATLAIITITVLVLRGHGQGGGFNYKPVPKNYLEDAGNDTFRAKADKLLGSAVDLKQFLPAGYVKDGSVDYTQYLQAGLDQHKQVRFPDFPVLINEQGLRLRDASVLVFPKGARLLQKPNNLERYSVLRIYGVQNVEVYYPVIVGDRKQHTGRTGEWGMGIDIRSASNVTIVNPVVADCWGDGICIGQQSIKHPVGQNINIYNAVLDNNRRNGISVASVKGLKIIRPVISNTNGTLPMCGIDIEPNGNYNTIEDVTVSNAITFNNANAGLVVNLSALPGKDDKEVNILIDNHLDDGSKTGFYISGVRKPKTGRSLQGLVQVRKSTWRNNVQACDIGSTFDYSPDIRFSGFSIDNTGARSAAGLRKANDVESLKRKLGRVGKIKVED